MLTTVCGACGAEGAAGSRFCSTCGEPLETLTADRSREERRLVTVLFSDAAGYTTMAESLDPETLRELMGVIYTTADEIVTRYGGRVDKLMGDAVLAVFGDPVAHEDDAERAVRAAMELHEAVDVLRPRFEAVAGAGFEMHSGLNSGVIVTSGQETDRLSGPLGDMVNVAARLQGLAVSGEILVGPDTARLIVGRFDLTDLGMRDLKGRRDPVQVRRIERTSAVPASRLTSEFIGRKEELGLLLGAVDALRDRRSTVVTICAEGGAGKTRLLEEFRANVDDDVRWLEGRAYPYSADTPYAAVVDLLNRVAQIDETDRSEEVRSKLTTMVAAVLPGDHVAADVVGHLYGLVPARPIDLEAFRSVLLDVLVRLLDGFAANRPTVLALQDLHWVDPSTAALIRRLLTSLSSPLLTVCNFRPGFSLGVEGERALELAVFSPRETVALVESLLPGADPPDGLAEWLAARTDGNPFFIEEIVNSLIDRAVLVRRGEGWELTRSLGDDTVPPTIQGLLAARIDGLDADARRVLREASVVGREFLHRIVQSITDEPASLDSSLERLSATDFIRRNDLDPELEYIFKHALTQEVAYEGLLLRDRQQMHERVARSIEAHLNDRIAEFVEALAFHYQRSGHVREAVEYLRRSGRKARDRYAMAEADHQYAAAYSLLTAEGTVGVVIDERERDRLLVETILEWSEVFYYRGALGELHTLHRHHGDLVEQVDDDALAARWKGWEAMVAWAHLGKVDEPAAMLDETIRLAEECGDRVAETYAHAWATWMCWQGGRTAEGCDMWPRLEALLPQLIDPAQRQYAHIKGLAGAVCCAALQGRTTWARQGIEELSAIGRSTGNRRALAMASLAEVVVELVRGDADACIAAARAAVDAGADPGYAFVAEVWATGIEIAMGDPVVGRRWFEDAAGAAYAAEQGMVTSFYDYMSAQLDVLEGRLSRGVAALEAQRSRHATDGITWGVAQIDLFLATALARVASGEIEGSIADALRNPGFVRRFGFGTAKKARQRLEAFDADLVDTFPALRPLARLELAKLELHEGRTERAAELLTFVRDTLVGEPDAPLYLEAIELLEAVRRPA